MAEDRPAFFAYPKDWLSSTRVGAMSLAAQGLYWRLLCHQWLSGHLPSDEADLRRLAGVERAEWRKVWPSVRPMFALIDGGLVNHKLEAVRTDTHAFTMGASRAGKASAEARRAKYGSAQPGRPAPNTPPNGTPNGSGTRSPNSSPNGSTERAEPSSSSSSSSSRSLRRGESDQLATDGRARATDVSPTTTTTAGVKDTLLFVDRHAWLSLAESWNTHTAARLPRVATEDTPPESQARLLRALRALPDLDAWEARFRRVAASSYLTGQRPGRQGTPFIADLWWVLDHVVELDAGRYDDRKALPIIATEASSLVDDDALARIAAQQFGVSEAEAKQAFAAKKGRAS